MTLGRALAGLNAYAKGQAIGVYRKHPARKKPPIAGRRVALMHRSVPVVRTHAGVRAVAAGRPIDPAGVERYLRGKFGADYTRVRGAMRKLAQSFPPALLAERAYPLYLRFRPTVAAGRSGWGQRSVLSLKKIAAAARRSESARRIGGRCAS
ncbi:MAG: hypothetical protein AB7G15_20715 [Alphaproteobacteria bacterium]